MGFMLGLLRVLLWAAGLGVAGFLLGCFGPLILTPESNQGPLLGYFYTGPGGAVLGALVGAWREWRGAHQRRPRQVAPADGIPYRRPGGRVHHTQIVCPMGRVIPEREKIYDGGGLPRCAECARLEAVVARSVTDRRA